MSTLAPHATQELDLEEAVLLPEREEMAFFNLAIINAVNLAIAANIGSVGSSAMAVAIQQITVNQG